MLKMKTKRATTATYNVLLNKSHTESFKRKKKEKKEEEARVKKDF